MKSFNELCDELKNENNELEVLWKKAKKERNKANRLSIIICLIIDLIYIFLIINKSIRLISLLSIIPLIIPVLIIDGIVVSTIKLIYSKNTINYNEKYKKVVINKLMGNFYDNLEYFPHKQMPEYMYRKNGYGIYDIYCSEDYMEGQIKNKYSIQMGEVLTEKKEEYKDSDGEIKTRTITLFHGLFAKIEMDKSINSELRIMQDGSFWKNQKLKMDSSEFEKYFDVKSSNQIIAMQLLTADVMQELIDFENKTKMKFDVVINNNELYLRFHSGDMFEVKSLKDGPLDVKSTEEYFYMLNFTYNLSNKLIGTVNDAEI